MTAYLQCCKDYHEARYPGDIVDLQAISESVAKGQPPLDLLSGPDFFLRPVFLFSPPWGCLGDSHDKSLDPADIKATIHVLLVCACACVCIYDHELCVLVAGPCRTYFESRTVCHFKHADSAYHGGHVLPVERHPAGPRLGERQRVLHCGQLQVHRVHARTFQHARVHTGALSCSHKILCTIENVFLDLCRYSTTWNNKPLKSSETFYLFKRTEATKPTHNSWVIYGHDPRAPWRDFWSDCAVIPHAVFKMGKDEKRYVMFCIFPTM